MPEQPDKCHEHHMLLKKMLEEFKEEFKEEFEKWKNKCETIQCFFFGGMHQAEKGELSFVDKVNLLYENQNKSRSNIKWFIGGFGVLIISSFIGLGVELQKIDNTVNTLANVVEKQRSIEIEVAQIKAQINK